MILKKTTQTINTLIATGEGGATGYSILKIFRARRQPEQIFLPWVTIGRLAATNRPLLRSWGGGMLGLGNGGCGHDVSWFYMVAA